MENLLSGLGTWTWRGDPFVTYNLPGRPIFDPITGAAFLVGLAWCVWRARRGEAAPAFALSWFVCGNLPTLITGAFASTSHSSGVQPVAHLFPALVAVHLARRWHWLAIRPRLTGALAVTALTLTAGVTYRDYFLRWGASEEVRAAYFADLAAATDYLRERAEPGVVALSSMFPTLPHDPFIGDLRIRRDDLDVRWFDGRSALVFPNVETAELVAVSSAPLDATWTERLGEIGQADAQVPFGHMVWNLSDLFERWLRDESVTQLRPHTNFGGATELMGYEWRLRDLRPEGSLRLVALWRVLDPAALGPTPPGEYGVAAAMTLRLVAADGTIQAQQDTLGAPAWNWHAGDGIAQLHSLSLPADLTPGDYRLEIGVYTLPSLQLLPVSDSDGHAIGELVVLETVAVE